MTEPDEFDKIVQGLSLDHTFPDAPAPSEEAPQPLVWAEDEPQSTPETPFYREVASATPAHRSLGTTLAWIGLGGAPMLLVIATVIGEILPRPMLAGAVLIFVAAAIYLFSQLPEHGPSRSDWPDDGAVL